jgi:hypothetical protein
MGAVTAGRFKDRATPRGAAENSFMFLMTLRLPTTLFAGSHCSAKQREEMRERVNHRFIAALKPIAQRPKLQMKESNTSHTTRAFYRRRKQTQPE